MPRRDGRGPVGRRYFSGYGRGPGRRMSLKWRPHESSYHESAQRAGTWDAPAVRGPDQEIRVLREQMLAIEGRLHYLNKRISRIEHGFTPSEFRAAVDPERCAACGICRDICPAGAISIEEIARVDLKLCIGCGSCAAQCPRGAIQLNRLDSV